MRQQKNKINKWWFSVCRRQRWNGMFTYERNKKKKPTQLSGWPLTNEILDQFCTKFRGGFG